MEEGRRQEDDHLAVGIDISRYFEERLKIRDDLSDCDVKRHDDLGNRYRDGEEDGGRGEEEEDDEEEEEVEFSFVCGGSDTQLIAAEDLFSEGKIKPIFSFLGRDSPFSSQNSDASIGNLLIGSPVKKVFVEIGDERDATTSSAPENDQVAGPYCEWSGRKAVEASRQVCKKSNSTGFSKIRRIRDFVGRSNSDGRDAFVFLSKRPPARTTAESSVAGPVKTGQKIGRISGNARKGKKKKKAGLSAHEVYMRSKAKEEEQRRSYLPYRTEFLGIFTNIHGGLSKNVHPF